MSKQKFSFRSLLFWPHLVVGLCAGIVIFILALTGSLLSFEREIVAHSDAKIMGDLKPAPTRLPMSALIARVEAQAGQPVTSITVPSDNRRPVSFEIGRERTFLADPSTGRVAGPASPGLRAFYRQVTAFHRWFGLADSTHHTVMLIKGWFTLAFVFLIVSGWYLWLPPSWTPTALRVRLRPGWAAKARAREFNWHNTFGIWFSIPLIAIALTGVIMALPWANRLLFRVTGSPMPAMRGGEHGGPGGPPEGRGDENRSQAGHRAEGHGKTGHEEGAHEKEGHEEARPAGGNKASDHATAAPVNYDRMIVSGAQQQANWQTLQIRVPAAGAHSVQMTVDRGNGAQPQLRDTLTFDATGNLQRTQFFAQQSLGQRARGVVRFLHTGEIFGIVGEFVGLLACLAGMLLVYTGFALSIRRFTRKTAQ